MIRAKGACEVITGDEIASACAFGPYDLILESVGGQTLATVLSQLAPGGTCVMPGNSASSQVTLDFKYFAHIGGISMYRLFLPYELKQRPVAEDLVLLVQMLAAGQLQAPIEVEAPWYEISVYTQRLLQRHYAGKVILRTR